MAFPGAVLLDTYYGTEELLPYIVVGVMSDDCCVVTLEPDGTVDDIDINPECEGDDAGYTLWQIGLRPVGECSG